MYNPERIAGLFLNTEVFFKNDLKKTFHQLNEMLMVVGTGDEDGGLEPITLNLNPISPALAA